MTKWQSIFAKHQRALPRSASLYERGQATRRAAAEYRGQRDYRRNPSGDNWFLWGAIAGAAWLVLSGKLGGMFGQKSGS